VNSATFPVRLCTFCINSAGVGALGCMFRNEAFTISIYIRVHQYMFRAHLNSLKQLRSHRGSHKL
jgi:hypothetical protein